jgi:peptide/nickel transport system ATP-binding protein
MNRLFEVRELTVRRAGAQIPELDRFSLAMDEGECVVLLGESGSGKEALMRVLGGQADRGDEVSGETVWRGGEPVSAVATKKTRPISVAYLPSPLAQPFAPQARVLGQLARLTAHALHTPKESAREELRLVLSRHDHAPVLAALDRRPAEIDAVTQAWGLLALAVCRNPDLVLAERPFADLGPTATTILLEALDAERKRAGFALLYAGSGLQAAGRLPARVIVIRAGRIVEEGDAARMAGGQAHAYTRTLFQALPQLTGTPPKVRSPSRGQPLLQVYGLDLAPPPKPRRNDYSAPRKREGLTFELRRGASLAFLGEEGSGRRAMVRALLCIDPPPRGRVVFDAVDLNILSRAMTARLRRRIAFITGDDESLDPRMTIRDTVEEPLRAHLGISGELIASYRDNALRRVGLASHDRNLRAADLSPFDRRRLQVARAIVSTPLLTVIDEPLKGLDAFAQAVMRETLADFRLAQESAFLIITSDFTVASAMAEEVFVFSGGRIVERGLISGVLKRPQEQITRDMIAAVTLPRLSPGGGSG